MAINPDENVLYIADSGNNVIRAVDLSTNQVSTFAGDGSCGYKDDVPEKAR